MNYFNAVFKEWCKFNKVGFKYFVNEKKKKLSLAVVDRKVGFGFHWRWLRLAANLLTNKWAYESKKTMALGTGQLGQTVLGFYGQVCHSSTEPL